MLKRVSTIHILYSFFAVLLLCALALPSIASAQIVPRFQATDISFELTPENPEAFEEVVVQLRTFAIDLDLHNITWLVNGERIKSGFGEKSATIKVGAYGETTDIDVFIESQDGRTVRKDLILRPATVDLLWEAADAYVPPFYQGKALPARGAVIKITAMPNLVVGDTYLDHNELDYTWKWNFKTKGDVSGFNQQAFGIKNNFLNRKEHVSVQVQNTQGTIRGEGTTEITFHEPELLFYRTQLENNPDLRRALTSSVSAGTGAFSLTAVPYFLSVRPGDTLDSLSYLWEANDAPIAGDKTRDKNQLTINPTGQGLTALDLFVNQPVEDMQSVRGSINIISQ